MSSMIVKQVTSSVLALIVVRGRFSTCWFELWLQLKEPGLGSYRPTAASPEFTELCSGEFK